MKSAYLKIPVAEKISHDPLGLALVVAIALHAFVILAVTFDLNKDDPPRTERTLDITLVQPSAKPEETVEKPDFLAQQSQLGSGEKIEKEHTTNPLGNPTARQAAEPAVELQRSGAPVAKVVKKPEVITTKAAPREVVTPPPEPQVQAQPTTRISELLASTQQEIDRLTAELDRRTRSASDQRRRKAVNASTQEYKYASYLEAWRRKVENIGNLNYPDEARRRGLYGNLLMHVALHADGSIERIRIVRSSGHKVLDDAAIRIVRLAAPFSPFPPGIRDEVDILDITRTWQFLDGDNAFSAR